MELVVVAAPEALREGIVLDFQLRNLIAKTEKALICERDYTLAATARPASAHGFRTFSSMSAKPIIYYSEKGGPATPPLPRAAVSQHSTVRIPQHGHFHS